MRKTVVMLAGALALCAQGAWYWPFGTDEDSTNAPPRLHRLLEPANDYIELAQDASLNGDTAKALENYRLALEELDRVEAEHPDRAASAEFAPLRLRRAACTAAIDSIRFAQVNENVRPVSVTDTTELQKRWNKAHGVGGDEDEPPAPPAESKAEKAAKKEPEKEKKAESPAPAEEERRAGDGVYSRAGLCGRGRVAGVDAEGASEGLERAVAARGGAGGHEELLCGAADAGAGDARASAVVPAVLQSREPADPAGRRGPGGGAGVL